MVWILLQFVVTAVRSERPGVAGLDVRRAESLSGEGRPYRYV